MDASSPRAERTVLRRIRARMSDASVSDQSPEEPSSRPYAPRWNSSGRRSGSAPRSSTRAATSVWSPPSYSAHSSQSIQATTSSRTGEPCRLRLHGTPANLSTPERAKLCDSCVCSSASRLTQNRPISRSRGQVVEVRAGAKTTSGGSSDRELNDWQVKPIGPSAVSAVTTVTPEAKWPRTSRIRRGSTGSGTSAAAATVPANHRSAGGRRPGDGAAARAVQGTGQLVPDGLLGHRGRGEDCVEVEPRAHAGLLEHVDQLLGGDVAAGARRERAAAEAADGGVQLGDPGLDGGERIRLTGAAGVVEVHADGDARAGAADRVEQLHDAQRRRRPDGVAEAELVRAGGDRGPRDVDRAADRRPAVERAVPGRGDDDLQRAAGTVREPGDLTDRADRLGGGATGVGAAVPVGGAHHVLEVGHAGVDGAAGSAGVGDQRRPVHVAPAGE